MPWTPASARPPVPESSRRTYRAYVRRHRLLLAACLLVGAASGGIALLDQPRVYTAVTRIVVTPQESSPGVELERPRFISLDSDAQVLMSVRVLGRAAEATGFPGGFDGLDAETAVTAIPDSRILVVRVSDVDPARAVAAASSIADEFLRVRAAAAELRAEAARAPLVQQITNVSSRLLALRETASVSGGLLLIGQQIEERELTATLAELQAELARSVLSAADPGSVVTPAQVRKPGGRPMGLGTLASGILLGGVLGLATSSVLDQVRGIRGLRPIRRPALSDPVAGQRPPPASRP